MIEKRNASVPASYLVLIKENRILLSKRFNTGFQDGKYSMVAGHVEAGESFTNCIIREAKEEAGITIDFKNLKAIHFLHLNSHTKENNERIDVFFITKKWEGEIINNEPNKCSDLSWFDLDNLPPNTIPYIKKVIEKIQDNIYYSEIGWN